MLFSSRAKPVWSTAKDVLERLRPLHPLPGVILEWRRLTAALSKVVFPLQRVRTSCSVLAMDRIHCDVDTFTATGRVTMHEPNLQNVPKDFVIEIPSNKLCAIVHCSITHTRPFNSHLSRTTWVGRYQKGKPVWTLPKQETVSGSGTSWAICKSAPHSRQITTLAPHHSVFYRPDALPATQPTASKH